ncbi:MAG: penicillin acylase family protein [Cyclobacteriaceae bacterium]
MELFIPNEVFLPSARVIFKGKSNYMRTLALIILIAHPLWAQFTSPSELDRMKEQASRVTIIRDQWGVAHVYGKSDADAVFGMLYAQCEDDFNRVEMNYVTALGRMSEIKGPEYLYRDLRMRLYNDSTTAAQMLLESPLWLQSLCQAFADGVNYYLHTHADVKPKVINRFQPWMPFVFSEGSIGGDIESISASGLGAFYGPAKSGGTTGGSEKNRDDDEPRGSNGFALAPKLSASGHALLLINPHTSYYFRDEMHVSSEEGLNAYGAATWGQFFIYQGFNENCGWMHTSSAADVIDEYNETVQKKDGAWYYRHGEEWKPMTTKSVTIRYLNGEKVEEKSFTTFGTHHGPVVRSNGEKWVSVAMMHEPVKALMQSFLRTKAKDLGSFNETMQLRTNSSNNTVFADSKGNIAYFHGNFMPRRDPQFDWSKPVEGADLRTDWKGLHEANELVQISNPAIGWIQNCNATPFTVSGNDSPKPSKYPEYMAPDAENARGIHAVGVLSDAKDVTLEGLIDLAYDPYLPGFKKIIPSLVKAFDQIPTDDGQLKARLREPIEMLGKWDLKWDEASVPTTLAIFWGQALRDQFRSRFTVTGGQLGLIDAMTNQTTASEKIQTLALVVDQLNEDFGTWKMPWGAVNRFQRLTGDIEGRFDDNQPSLPVGFTSSFWGSLASVGSRPYANTKKWYGTSGNSFVAVVDFGPKVKAKAITAGGISGDPASPYFTNQAEMFCKGQFKDVAYYKEDVLSGARRQYHPGE